MATFLTIKWTRDHKSACGRFWCYKAPRSDEWQLWDSAIRDGNGAAKRTYHRTLRRAKEYADYVMSK